MKSEIFLERVEKDPTNALFRFSLGQALFEEASYEAAIEHLHFCVDSRSDWMLAQILLGKALLNVQKADEAKNIFEQALELAISQHHEGPEAELRQILADL